MLSVPTTWRPNAMIIAWAQLLDNLIICDHLKLLGKNFIDRPCFVMYQLSLL